MISIRALASVMFSLVGLLLASGALAEINPADMVSGYEGALPTQGGQSYNRTLFTVPSDSVLVLTDFTWTPTGTIQHGNYWEARVSIFGPGGTQWSGLAYDVRVCVCDSLFPHRVCATWADHQWPIQEHWSTGLVFRSGSVVELTVDTEAPGTQQGIMGPPFDDYCAGWVVTWSGYLVPSSGAGLGDLAPELGTTLKLAALPNPVGSMASIEFTLPEPDKIVLAIFDVSGRRVRTLHKGTLPAGTYSMPWDGRNDRGIEVADGIYLARLETKGGSQVAKVSRVR